MQKKYLQQIFTNYADNHTNIHNLLTSLSKMYKNDNHMYIGLGLASVIVLNEMFHMQFIPLSTINLHTSLTSQTTIKQLRPTGNQV